MGGMMTVEDINKWAKTLRIQGNVQANEIVRGVLSLNERTGSFYLKCPTINKESESAVDDVFRRQFPAVCEEYEKTFWPDRVRIIKDRQSENSQSQQKGDGKAARDRAQWRKNAFLIKEVQSELVKSGMTVGELRDNIQKRINSVAIHEE